MKTLIIGASPNPERYAYKAAMLLQAHKHEINLLGLRESEVSGVPIQTGFPAFTDIDTVTLYLNAERQEAYYTYIIALQPRRIIFNPGTENAELVHLAKANNIMTEYACTLVLLRMGVY
jgi:uncharacterized protein